MKFLLRAIISFCFTAVALQAFAQGPPATFSGSASGTTITLSWSTTTAGTDGYFIRAKRNPGGTYPTLPLATDTHPLASEDADLSDGAGIHDVNAQATASYNGFSGAIAGAQYDFEIYSYDDNGDSQSATPATTTVYTLATTPGAYPGSFTFSAAAGASSIGITFTKASKSPMNAHGYVVLRKAGANPGITGLADGPAPAGTDFLGIVTDSTTTSFTDNTAVPGISYTYALVPYRVGFNGAAPIVGTYKYGNISTFSSATVPLVAAIVQQTGGVSNSLIATNTNKALIGFSFTSNGSQTITDATFTLSATAASLGLTSFELWESNVATYDGVSGSVVATGGNVTVTGSTVAATGFTATTSKYYFLIADVSASAGATTFNIEFSSASSAGTISTTAPYFSHSGITITALSLTLNQLTTGVAASPLGAGSTGGVSSNAILGFSITTNGTVDLSSIKITIPIDAAVALGTIFTNYSLIESPDNSFTTTTSHSVAVANADISASGTGAGAFITLNPATDLNIDATTKYYFLVASVAGSVSTAVHVQPSLIASDLTFVNGAASGGPVTGINYSFQGSQTSTITLNGGTTTTINYASFTDTGDNDIDNTTDSENIGTFRLRDVANDPDALSTTLTSLQIQVTNAENLDRISLFVGDATSSTEATGTLVDQAVSGSGTVTFSFTGLSIVAADNGASNGDQNFTVRASFKTTVTDNSIIQVTITGATTLASGSGLASFSATTGGSANDIEVTATKLIFVDALNAQFNGPINATPFPQTGSTFNATVAAVDANSNLDLDNTASVSLNITPNASVTFTGGSAVALTAGKHTYTLTINKANTYSLGATDGGGGLTDATSGNSNDVTVNIISLGVTIGKADLSACQVNSSNIFTPLPLMSFSEADNSDFSPGTNLTLLIILPEGWEFLTPSTSSPTPAYAPPTITYTPSRNFTAATFTGFLGSTIARFTYTVNNTDLQDLLSISGLYVKNVNGGAAADILRSGTGLIQGADDTKSLGVLSTSASPSATFTVEASPNQSAINPNETNFSNGSQAIILNGEVPIGNAINAGVFTGSSVVYNAIGAPINAQRYTFNPNTLDPGIYPVTYTYSNPTTGCVSVATKNFNVFASAIDGLANQYCVNNSATQTLNVNPAFMPSGYDFVNYSITFPSYKNMTNVVNMGSNLEITVPNHGLQNGDNLLMYISGGFGIGYIYGNYTITRLDANTFTIPVSTSGSWYGYGYVYLPQPSVTGVSAGGSILTITAPNHGLQVGAKIYHYINGLSINGGVTPNIEGWFTVTSITANSYTVNVGATVTGFWIPAGTNINIFDYQISSFKPNMASTLNSRFSDVNFYYVGFMVRPNPCGSNCSEFIWNNQYVGINPLPIVSFSGLLSDYCRDNSVPANLIGNQPDGNFIAAPTFGLTDGPNNTATFLASAGGITTESPITVTYSYTDFNGCTNSVSQITTVHALPVVQAGANQDICNGTSAIIGGAPTASVAYTVPTPIFSYQWDNAASLDNAANSNPRATPTATTTYTVTVRDGYGCQNTATTDVNVFTPAGIVPLLNDTICGSNTKALALSGLLTGSATSATWSTPNGTGNFRQGVTNNTSYGQADNYAPSVSDVNILRNVSIALTTNDPAGPCPAATASLNLIINPAPVAAAGIDQTYCANDAMKITGTITGSATSVTWSTTGLGSFTDPNSTITQYVPHPSELISNPTITVTITSNDPDGVGGPCLPSADIANLTINARATINAGADFAKCFDDTNIILSGSKPIGSTATAYTWTGGTGIFSDNTILTPVYTPGPGESGNDVLLTITSNDPDGVGPTGPCLAESSVVRLTVNPDPAAPILISPPPICVNGISPNLQAIALGGYTYKWYNDPLLTPASNFGNAPTVPSGVNPSTDQKVTFYATQTPVATGCESAASSVTVTVNPNPVAVFTAANFCYEDITQFTDASTLTYTNGNTGSINQWSWNFGDPTSGLNTSTSQNPGHQYTSIGSYNPILTVTTTDGCSRTIDYITQNSSNQLRIGPVPITDFNFKKICDQDITNFVSDAGPANVETGLVYAWDFGDLSSGPLNTSIVANPSHKFSKYGSYTAQLVITTPLGCTDGIVKQVPILPYLDSLANFPYFQDFEDNSANPRPVTPHGWVAQAVVSGRFHDGLSSWQLSTPNGTIINNAKSGTKAWFTRVDSLNTYFNAERSVLYGPCINVDSLDRPILSFDYWNNTDSGNDGVYLEVAVPDASGNINWTKFGDLSTGINWYNRGQILGLTQVGSGVNAIGQAVGQLGWTGSTKTTQNPAGWVNARYSLDEFATTNKLMIRFVFGSNPDNPDVSATPLDGFALDNFKLSSRNRQVLAENFTNGLVPQANNNTAFVNFKKPLTNKEIVKIQYHTNLAGKDPLNDENQADPSARATFYGITNATASIPRIYIDGYSEGDFVPNDNWGDTYFSKQTLVDAPMTIEVGTQPAGEDGTMVITTTLTALEDIPVTKGKMIVHTAVIEKVVGTNEFVLRKMLPSAAGRLLTLPLSTNDVVTLDPLRWKLDNSNIESSDLSIVVFVQDQITREIYQTAIDSLPANPPTGIITGTEDPEYVKNIHVYPNPANQLVNIELPAAAAKPTPVVLIDAFGKTVYQSEFRIGEKTKAVSTETMANGVYMLQLTTPGGSKAVRKVMVKH